MKTIKEYFKIYSNLYQFEEGLPEYLIDEEDFEKVVKEIIEGAIKEDRENIAKHAKVTSDYYSRYDLPNEFKNWWVESHGNIGERTDGDGDVIGLDIFSIDKNSIINAPIIELK